MNQAFACGLETDADFLDCGQAPYLEVLHSLRLFVLYVPSYDIRRFVEMLKLDL